MTNKAITSWLHNLRLFDGDRISDDMAVAIRDDQIIDIRPRTTMPQDVNRHDLHGLLLAPGFIDVQVNGGGGIMFNDQPDMPSLSQMFSAHRRYGSTSILPTLISDNWETMKAAADSVRKAIQNDIAGIVGIHFEGPYLNPLKKGAHQQTILRPPDPGAFEILSDLRLGQVMITLAPEMVEMDFIRQLAQAGVRVCAGHSAADYATTCKGIDAGITGFTHLFNAMTGCNSREPGVVGAALDSADTWCSVIVDGYHVHQASLRIAHAAKAAGKMVLVTDAMATVGAEVKQFNLYGDTIQALDGRCATKEGILAGSDLDMAAAVRNVVKTMHLPVEEALRMASLYPAQWIGMDDRLGRIRSGHKANLVLLDSDLMVKATWLDGIAEFY